MKSNVTLLKSISIKIGTFIFGIVLFGNFLIKGSLSIESALECLSTSIVITSIIIVLINRFFWKNILKFLSKNKWIWAFFEQYECPILYEKYNCLVKYEYPLGCFGEKNATVKISQTYTSVTIDLYTDEIKSRSLISEIVKECDEFILYYTYRTNPKAQYLDNNKGQHGGCRIVLDSITNEDANKNIEGVYWTTSKTKGDMSLSSK
ncbi:hypothetical protein CI088_11170 [Enterococcus plantarum]|uniref:CD-NTase-associated protein 15 domain-containing protein n=1 Tax=Enterococcus plantarum TaxID=1077675 RepID=A0A2W3YX02_9ENTE|nr:hypothetical protein [Enterococcus plantarum]PZL72161.1 hypothetical protein CI088_11170 [Enterococcus plantarum]